MRKVTHARSTLFMNVPVFCAADIVVFCPVLGLALGLVLALALFLLGRIRSKEFSYMDLIREIV